MDRGTELDLLDELVDLKAARSTFLDETVTASPVERYASAARFKAEQDAIFRTVPQIVAHAGELSGNDAFLTRQVAGLPVLITRDAEGTARAFLNVCRHRGTRLVDDAAGCRRIFTCPYHAWSFDNRGALKGLPHAAQGFPDLDREAYGLKPLGCEERFGWIWLLPQVGGAVDAAAHLDGLGDDFAWLAAEDLTIAHSEMCERAINWKIVLEGGIEAYHIKIAHRNTIDTFFQDNLSSYRVFGRHLRTVLPRNNFDEMTGLPRTEWSARQFTSLLYTVFPTSQLLVQKDHMSWLHVTPLAADRTLIRRSTLVPRSTGRESDSRAARWRKNHEINIRTLDEDFALGESIQSSLESGANDSLLFGRFEGALDSFNRIVEAHLQPQAA